MNKEAGRKIIAERIEDFEKNKAILTKKGHGETNIRSNYIDIMFKALGWDMKSHYEVVREYSQRDKSTDGGTKKVDYAFKINGKLKFFIEAKEASVDLEKDKAAIFQAKRYAYSSNGKAPIVILTDFEEFRVFNVIKAPLIENTDRELLKSHTMKYTDYLEKWDLLWDTFSRDAVENGSLDKLKGKIDKNTKTMDVDFLEQITSWRESLAKNIAIRNENLNVDEINEAVQRILDRLVFIRNLEDREIEPENTLLDKAKKSENIYKSIIPIFNSLNTTYNGLLFKKHFSEDIEVDDKTIKDIIRQMCYPVSPFQFDVIEPEILGRIYEKFLGSKIRLTDNHRAKIEEKIEVRKAGGVYYTPEYIVEYIVQNTVGKKIEGLTPEEIKKMKILDPACGSGSFLIGAYSYLLDYHHKWYTENQKDKTYQADWYKTKEGEIKVRIDKRGDILRNNIFGVDIDKEATEVTIMSLYLKMLDDGFDKGERDLFFVKGSILPDMLSNIKCGNSIIGLDVFDGKFNCTSDEEKKLNPFDWHVEFKNIFNNGKFDCVIGNPPWIDIKGLDNFIVKILFEKYSTVENRMNIYSVFIHKSLELLKDKGLFGFITPSSFLTQSSYNKLRTLILNTYQVKNIVRLPDNVFENVTAESAITIIENEKDSNTTIDVIIYDPKININTINPDEAIKHHSINQFEIINSNEFVINLYLTPEVNDILNKIENDTTPLLDICDFTLGLTPYDKYKGHSEKQIKEKVFHSDKKINDTYKPLLSGENIQRFYVNWDGKEFIKYGPWLGAPREQRFFTEKRILIRQIVSGNPLRIYAGYTEEEYYNTQIAFNLLLNGRYNVNLKYILGIINSKLMNFYHRNKYLDQSKNVFQKILIENAKKFPVKIIDGELYNNVIDFTEQIIKENILWHNAKLEKEKDASQRKIIYFDNKIDELVYKIYNLTEEEINIIESE